MAYNREKLFPDPAQRELQDAADAVQTAAEKLSYATRKVPLDDQRLMELTNEIEACQKTFNRCLLRVL
jgi:hypothetical protein